MTDHTDPSGQDLRKALIQLHKGYAGQLYFNDIALNALIKLFEKHTAVAIFEAERRAYGLVRAKQIYFDQVGWTASANNLEEVLAALRQGGNGEGA